MSQSELANLHVNEAHRTQLRERDLLDLYMQAVYALETQQTLQADTQMAAETDKQMAPYS